jgi:adenylate cyclase, class 2
MILGIETEVKIPLADRDGFIGRLRHHSAAALVARHFEDNFILDTHDRRLRGERSLLRVRLTDGGATLTFKGPPRPDPLFKSREELETSLKDGASALEILSRLGFRVSFRYQKYREEFLWQDSSGGHVHISVDTTPIGDYIELEGTGQGILDAAQALGLRESDFMKDSYYSLYEKHCRESGQPAGHMTFPPANSGGTGEGRK